MNRSVSPGMMSLSTKMCVVMSGSCCNFLCSPGMMSLPIKMCVVMFGRALLHLSSSHLV